MATPNHLPKTNTRIAAEFAAGVFQFLDDETHGRRSMRWLCAQVNTRRPEDPIALATFRYRLTQSPRNFTFVDHDDIAQALGTTVDKIIELGAAALDEEAA